MTAAFRPDWFGDRAATLEHERKQFGVKQHGRAVLADAAMVVIVVRMPRHRVAP